MILPGKSVKKLHEGLFSNQDAREKARAHHAALQKLGCFDELCAVLAKRVDFSASYVDNSIILGTAHALLNTLLFFAGAKRQTSSSSTRSMLACSRANLQSLGMAQMSSVHDPMPQNY